MIRRHVPIELRSAFTGAFRSVLIDEHLKSRCKKYYIKIAVKILYHAPNSSYKEKESSSYRGKNHGRHTMDFPSTLTECENDLKKNPPCAYLLLPNARGDFPFPSRKKTFGVR